MKTTNQRDGGVTLKLSADEGKHLWALIREGRKALVANNEAYRSTFAFDLMQAMPITDMGHIQNLVKQWAEEDK